MSTDYSLYSANLRIKSSDWEAMTKAAKKPLGNFFDSVEFEVLSDHDGMIAFDVYFSGEAGDSFPQKVDKFANVIGKYLLDAGKLTLREDTSSDERDQIFFAGPTPESIRLAEIKDSLTCAQEHLLHALPNGDDDRTPAMSAVTGVTHGLVHALGLIEKSINVEREARSVSAPAAPSHEDAASAPAPGSAN